jgi:hypothetical protein
LLLVIGHFGFQFNELLKEPAEESLAHRRELVLFGFKFGHQGSAKRLTSFGQDDAIFRQQPSHFINQRRAGSDKPFTHAMQGLNVLLMNVFNRHEAHVGTRHRLGNRFGVTQVIFVRFHIWFDVLRRHQLHVMTLLAQTPRPIMGAATRFHPDDHRWQLRHKRDQFSASQAFAHDDFAPFVHPHEMEDPLCDIDAHYANMWCHVPRSYVEWCQ